MDIFLYLQLIYLMNYLGGYGIYYQIVMKVDDINKIYICSYEFEDCILSYVLSFLLFDLWFKDVVCGIFCWI